MAKSVVRRFDKPKHERAQAQCGQRSPTPIQPAGGGLVFAFGYLGEQDEERDGGHWNVDEEQPAPGSILHQDGAKQGTQGHRDGRSAGPQPEGAAALLLLKGGGDNGKAGWPKHSAAQSLEYSSKDEEIGAGGKTTQGGGDGKNNNADAQDFAAAHAISQ